MDSAFCTESVQLHGGLSACTRTFALVSCALVYGAQSWFYSGNIHARHVGTHGVGVDDIGSSKHSLAVDIFYGN
jgi:hypothetical protein